MDWLKSFLEEHPGVGSSMRVAFILMIVTAIGIAVYQVITTATHTLDISNFLTMTGTASTLKVVQKGQENNSVADRTPDKT